MTGNRDRQIWRIARGLGPNPAEVEVGDSDTPPFIEAGTNEPGKGPNGAHIYLDGTEAISKMKLGPGMKVELFASEKEFPELVNPVQMAFDTQRPALGGGVEELPALAAEDADGRQAPHPRGHQRRRQGRQAHGLRRRSRQPHRLRVLERRRHLAQAPNLVFLKDTNGDDKADTRQILLGGMDSADTHHTVNSFTFDPGGALYFQEGIFHRTQVETP